MTASAAAPHWAYMLASALSGAAPDPRVSAGLAMAQWRDFADSFFGFAPGLTVRGVGGITQALRSTGDVSRKAKLYRPDSAPPGAPLVVMLHGCMQSAESFARLTGMSELAKRDGFCVLYPDQDSDANAMQCWNWHDPSNHRRGSGEPEALAELIQKAQKITGSTADNTHIAGISAGGALASLMAHLYPELLDSCAIMAGPMPFSAQGLRSALSSMRSGPQRTQPEAANLSSPRGRLPMLIIHGQSDEVVSHKHALSQAEGAVSLHKALRCADGGDRALVQVESVNREQGDVSVWSDAGGAPIAVVVSPAGLKHAWSGGDQGEPFSQKGFCASRLALSFFKAAETGDFAEFGASGLSDRLWGARESKAEADAVETPKARAGMGR